MDVDDIVRGLRESCTGNEFAPPMVTNRELTEAADLIESLQAQLAERDKEIDRLSQLAMMRDSETGDRDRKIERLRQICQPVCRSCGLANDRHFINNSCDRCGGDLRLSEPPEKGAEK